MAKTGVDRAMIVARHLEPPMCTNYAAARRDQLFKHFSVEPPDSPWRDEVYKSYPAPIIRRVDGAERADVRHRAAQAHSRRCQAFRHDECTLGDCRREAQLQWRIGMASGEPFAIAGLWREWSEPEALALSFTMLTGQLSQASAHDAFSQAW